MAKNSKELLEETEKLKIENETLRQQLKEAKDSIDAIKSGNIDALVITHEKDLKIYTEKTADKPYRILIEKMHEGAVTLNEDGSILFCNSSFANMVNLPFQKIAGTKFERYMDDSFKGRHAKWLNPGRTNAVHEESHIIANGGKVIPVLITVNALTLDNILVLNIILTDLTIQNENQERLKVKAKLIEEKNKELENTNKELAYQNEEKEKRATELALANKELAFQNEEKEKRAAELVIANKELAFQNEEKEKRANELSIADKELEYQSGEKEKRAAELSIADKELEFQSGEKEKRAAELIIANKELEFQNKEKDKRAAELAIANKELEFQSKEKGKRAAELIVANKELGFQNEEKDKRAKELAIANKELEFQNEEKDKRAAELVIANKELAYQNEEKEKRATELALANKELAFQHKEKEKRATELAIANKELAYQNEEKDKRAAELIIVETDVKELVGLNTHKERILSTIAHDLRSPLAGIIQTTELLKEDFETMEAIELKERLELLYNLSIDELSMLDSLVDWARIKFASDAFSPANIELVKYVKKVFATFNEIAVANEIQLSYEIADNTIVYADKKMLLSILQNIISNSLKNTHPGGKVTALAQRKEDKIIVEIRDTGIGMSKAVKEKLFAPQMEDLSKARKEKKGAGIGLLLIAGFVNKNGGEINVESIEGKGTSFYFTLPSEKI